MSVIGPGESDRGKRERKHIVETKAQPKLEKEGLAGSGKTRSEWRASGRMPEGSSRGPWRVSGRQPAFVSGGQAAARVKYLSRKLKGLRQC